MPLAVLLNSGDPIFDFEHAMAHREYLAVMAPLNRFSALPYFIEPWPFPNPPLPSWADAWNLDHQRAHNDFASALPAVWQPNTVYFGVPMGQNLVDSDLNDAENFAWWTFANHQEHFIANNAILPLQTTTATPLPPTVTYPFW